MVAAATVHPSLFKSAFEIHAIVVKSLPENRQFDTIKFFTGATTELIYIRPEGVSIPENHSLLLRSPKVGVFNKGCDEEEAGIIIGDADWGWVWHARFDPKFGIQYVVVEDPKFPEAAVEIFFETFQKPAQACFRIILKDKRSEDREIKIIGGEIWATSNGDARTKRPLVCFGDDRIKRMLSSPSKSPKFGPLDLYRSDMVLPAKSKLCINFHLKVELVSGGGTTPYSISFNKKASFRAPAHPLQGPERRRVRKFEIDEFASVKLKIFWFNNFLKPQQVVWDNTIGGEPTKFPKSSITTTIADNKVFISHLCLLPAFEFHAIKVVWLHEQRKFNTIKLITDSQNLIYLRPEGISLPDNHSLLLRGPKLAAFRGRDDSAICIGPECWRWYAYFDARIYPDFGIQSVVVRDPKFPDAALEIIFERISRPAQAHFNFIFKDTKNKDRQINIVRGEIAAISNGDVRTKRLLRCFGEHLIKHMLPSSWENPEFYNKIKCGPFKLVSEESIGLYRSHMVLPTGSELIIGLCLQLEIVTEGGTRQSSTFHRKASTTAPARPKWLQNKDFIPRAMEITKETCILKIDEFAEIQLEVSWFNDNSECFYPLLGYGDGDCDYKQYVWTDRHDNTSLD